MMKPTQNNFHPCWDSAMPPWLRGNNGPDLPDLTSLILTGAWEFHCSSAQAGLAGVGLHPDSKTWTFPYLTGWRSLGAQLFRVWDPQAEWAYPSQAWACSCVWGEQPFVLVCFCWVEVAIQGIDECFPLSMYIPPYVLLWTIAVHVQN